MGGQLLDLDFGSNEDIESWDVGGRHLGSHGIQRGLCGDDEEEYKLADFWTATQCAVDFLCTCPHK